MYDNFHIPFSMPIIRLGGVYPIHMANSQTINKVVFLSYAGFNSCQYKARKETIGKSENDSNKHYSPLCPFLCFINKVCTEIKNVGHSITYFVTIVILL